VGPRAVLDTMSKKIPSLHRESNSDHRILQSVVAIPTDLSRLTGGLVLLLDFVKLKGKFVPALKPYTTL
jgi:hypothetical protein